MVIDVDIKLQQHPTDAVMRRGCATAVAPPSLSLTNGQTN